MKKKTITIVLFLIISVIISCKKDIDKINVYGDLFSLIDENNNYLSPIDGNLEFSNNIKIFIEGTEYYAFPSYGYGKIVDPALDRPVTYTFEKIKINITLPYDIIFTGDNIGKYILFDQFFNEDNNYIPSVSLTEKSKAVITDFSIDSLRFITSPYMYTKGVFIVSGKVSKEENKPFRSFVIYLGDENVSSTNYDLKFNPKLSQENFNYFDDGSFIFTDTIRFGMSQNLHYLDCFYESEYVYAVAYGKAGLDVYDSNVPYYDENYGSMYGSYYDVYYDPVLHDTIDPGLGEPSNKAQFYFGTVPSNNY